MAYQGQLKSYENTEPNKIIVTDRILNKNPKKIIKNFEGEESNLQSQLSVDL